MSSPVPTPAPVKDRSPRGVILVSYPKVVFLYPSVIVALIAGLYMKIWGNLALEKAGAAHMAAISAAEVPAEATPPATEEPVPTAPVTATSDAPVEAAPDDAASAPSQAIQHPRGPIMMGAIFLVVLLVNVVVISFDFPRTTSVTLAAIAAAILLGVLLLSKYYENLIPFVSDLLAMLKPEANAMFYYCYAFGMLMIYGCVKINAKFDYWELRHNELLHHHGFMSDLERHPTAALKVNKEIKDIFEYMLLKSGRMILQAGGNQRPIVLENVFFIDKKEQQITSLLGTVQVQIAPSSPEENS
ncbi:MAG: hypothetical protein DWH91_03705 [Planctomycetota bacterium]|nr:MAG: hypothetical protein DWH91_03705 [Planctomycetota bacterium]